MGCPVLLLSAVSLAAAAVACISPSVDAGIEHAAANFESGPAEPTAPVTCGAALSGPTLASGMVEAGPLFLSVFASTDVSRCRTRST
jgi:hypothetical protein